MVTAAVSDLHLGTWTGADLVARPDVRRVLIDELRSVDQVVLLGDSIELRSGPPAAALRIAAPFFEELGEALAGRRVVVVPGNHDHQLASRWLARRGNAPLGLQQISHPEPGDPLAWLARRMPGAELVLAYPGLWLREDVYATHGHYLDCHNRVPTFECMACAVSERLAGRRRDGYRAPEDYEAVLGPIYRAIYRVTQSRRARSTARLARALARAWESRAFGRDALGVEVRRPGLRAMAQVVESLAIEAGYVLFGHLHRPGPAGGDGSEWVTGSGARLVNTGSWVYEPAYLGATPADSRYWPGTCVVVEERGPPVLRPLLHGLSHERLAGRT